MDSIPREEHFVFNLNDWSQRWGYRSVFAYNHRNYRYSLHLHDFVEINIVLKGTGKHYFNDKVFDVTRGNVFVVPVQSQHGYGDTVGLDVYHVLLHPRFITTHSAELFSLQGYLPLFTVEPHFRSKEFDSYQLTLTPLQFATTTGLLKMLESECTANSPDHHVASESLALFIVALLCRWYIDNLPDGAMSHASTIRTPSTGIQRCLDHIHHKFAEQITTTGLAQVACMERSHFTRIFQQCFNIPPMEFVRDFRVRAARELLLKTDKSVRQIATETGFYDASHFSRTFKECTGRTPREIRSDPA